MREIIIENACENNLKHVSLTIPHYQLIVVTGVSGSGKTSLVHDVLRAEGKRLFIENFAEGRRPDFKLRRPDVSRIEGLFPVIAIDQQQVVRNPRSTVGTLTGIYDMLRLLFARLGTTEREGFSLNRSLFSFNLPNGWCPVCKGLGVTDHIDPALLIADPRKTIRDGAFALTTPKPYIVYSQVTMEMLDQVCRAHGFNVDIPWQDLTPEQQDVVLNGSLRVKVLFGKHTLESRLNWTGMTAKPRREDYYRGIVPVMEEILKRDRNPSIMRFARSVPCELCRGKRLNENALSVRLWGLDMPSFTQMTIARLHRYFSSLEVSGVGLAVVNPVREAILRRTGLLLKLGAGYLTSDTPSDELKAGDTQRILLANRVTEGLRNVLYILDEPGAGLNPPAHADLLEVLRSLVNAGNTVMLVDHNRQSMKEADWIIDMGPGAGNLGGHVLYNGPAREFFSQPQPGSITWKYLSEEPSGIPGRHPAASERQPGSGFFSVNGNRLLKGALNVLTGTPDSGIRELMDRLAVTGAAAPGTAAAFRRIIRIDSTPIGRTPNSNPATYTGLSDCIRDLMAAQPLSRERGYKKGQFSFVIKGGRCESCGGAGVQQIGMHFLGNVQVVCDICEGHRFSPETLEVTYNGLNIYDILELTVEEAHRFFEGQKKITAITGLLIQLGLGYLKLGQPSATLSGGEAQRVKMAAELSRSSNGNTLYLLEEPASGLHAADILTLLRAFRELVSKGNTLVCTGHDPYLVSCSDRIVDMGQGAAREDSLSVAFPDPADPLDPIRFRGVQTNNLKSVDVEFPVNAITAVTGVSGSGKSSLVYGTLYAESKRRFTGGGGLSGAPVFSRCSGLVPAVSLQKKIPVKNPRSTVATYTGLYDLYRLLFSRLCDHAPLSAAFSFNTAEGACPVCGGLGSRMVCDPVRLVTDPHKSLIAGALDGTKTGRFYGDPSGQYVAALQVVGELYGIDYSVPYHSLDEGAVKLAMEGCGQEVFNVTWHYQRGTHSGVHKLRTVWRGFLHLVEDEYLRKQGSERGEALLSLMKNARCETCDGYRLNKQMFSFTIRGMHIGQVTALTAEDALEWFGPDFAQQFNTELKRQAAAALGPGIWERLNALCRAGLGYLATDRIVGTLSGGEFQRLQLAGLVRAPLTGVAYILDEPSFGLHPLDVERMGQLVTELNTRGNTIVMVDHSPILTALAGYTLELGPGAGNRGGSVVYWGPAANAEQKAVTVPFRCAGVPGKGLSIKGAFANNLKNIDLEIPSGVLSVITGVSGSGKTSLLDGVIYESHVAQRPVACCEINGFECFSRLIYVGQQIPFKNAGTMVADYLDIAGTIASVFAVVPECRQMAYKAAHFVKGSREGRCPDCEGNGYHKVSMDFFSDVFSPCERCEGTGFRDEILAVTVEGKNIDGVLHMTFDEWEGVHAFGAHKALKPVLDFLRKTGLGHLSPGRLLDTLSTGELQRLKLVRGLSQLSEGAALLLLDEPAGGLHRKDIELLLTLFDELITGGHTVLCVTHEPLLMDAAFKRFELGPGGGTKGGYLVG